MRPQYATQLLMNPGRLGERWVMDDEFEPIDDLGYALDQQAILHDLGYAPEHVRVVALVPVTGPEDPMLLFSGPIEARLTDEALVTIYPDGEAEVAFRSGLEAWGPPEPLEARETR